MTECLHTIAHIRSPFTEKFAVPRQPGLAPAAEGAVIFAPGFRDPDLIRGIEGFSHLWLIFGFHQTAGRGWRPLVRPPRLGGNHKVGVMATRSTHRPNPIGLSVVTLRRVEVTCDHLSLVVGGLDLVDGTPIYDIKPYVPFADSHPEAVGGYAEEPPLLRPVRWSEEALRGCAAAEQRWPQLGELVEQILAQDPRPAYRHGETPGRVYGVVLYDLDVRFQFEEDGGVRVVEIVSAAGGARQP